MVQEIFIIEDKADISGVLKPKFKRENDFILTAMNYRQITGAFDRYPCFDNYK